ncbi:hypothetical protein [Vibrio sp. MA40-2]|uniref:hypothetical protein n=1 Tax=Vibrio sp. MA40-2 TaxID=3391828 RepID=UPI0039A55E0B
MFNTLIKYGEWKWPNPVVGIELIKASERELSYLTKDKIQPFLNKLAVDNSPKADQILAVAVSGYDIFDVRYYAAWECVQRSLPAFIPHGQATHKKMAIKWRQSSIILAFYRYLSPFRKVK